MTRQDPHPKWDTAVQILWWSLCIPAIVMFALMSFRDYVKITSMLTLVLSCIALAEARGAKKESARGREDS